MIRKILILSRPRFWLYILGPYLISLASINTIDQLLRFEVLYGIFYFLLPANLFIYVINDYFDSGIDVKNPKKRRQETYMKENDKRLYQMTVLISLLLAIPLFLINSITTLAITIFLFFGFFYSSPPLRFKTRPYFDSLSNFFYIMPGIVGYTMLYEKIPDANIIIAGSIWCIAMHLFSAVVDIKSDIQAGIQTTATHVGYRNSLLLTSVLWFVCVSLVVTLSPLFILGYIYSISPILVLTKRITIQEMYWYFPWINTFLGLLLFLLVVYAF